MHRMRVAFAHKIASVGVLAFLLLGAPTQLAGQERGAVAAERVSVTEWFSRAWNDLTIWIVGSNFDSGCAIDPHGGCTG